MQAVILILIIIVTIMLGRFAIMDTERSRNQKKFMKNMEDFDENKK